MWRANLIQGKNQDRVQKDVINDMQKDPTVVKMVSDFACKFLPSYYREQQQQFFAKAGIVWFGTSFTFMHENKLYTKNIHLFANNAIQNATTTAYFIFYCIRWIETITQLQFGLKEGAAIWKRWA